MKIYLTPIRFDEKLTVAIEGDTLTLNGKDFDFSDVPEGGLLPQDAVSCDWLASDIERINGDLQLTLLLPHGANAPDETLFPIMLEIDQDGSVALPLYERENA